MHRQIWLFPKKINIHLKYCLIESLYYKVDFKKINCQKFQALKKPTLKLIYKFLIIFKEFQEFKILLFVFDFLSAI